MATPVILLGYGGNVVDVIDMIDDLNDAHASGGAANQDTQAARDGDPAIGPPYDILGFMDNRDELQGQSFFGYPMLGRFADAARYVEHYPEVRFTTWIGRVDTYLRRPKMIASLGVPHERFLTLVHPTTYLSRRAKIGRGALIFQHCTISNSAIIGDHVVILPQTIVSHDCLLGDYAVSTSGVLIASEAKVGRNAYLGSACSMLPGVKIGEGALVGLSSVVLRDVEPYKVMVGNPARVLRDVDRFIADY
jgi:sugar O-acyltransferase (sialic acid O-acetyltransferase NeuD family)